MLALAIANSGWGEPPNPIIADFNREMLLANPTYGNRHRLTK